MGMLRYGLHDTLVRKAYRLHSTAGAVERGKNSISNAGNYKEIIETSELSSGYYILRITVDESVLAVPIIVIH